MKIYCKILTLLLISIFFGNDWVVVHAATYYVDQNHGSASDSNAGTGESLPWLTLDHATDTVVAGDTVYVKAGTYTDTDQSSPPDGWYQSFNTANSGTSGNLITFISSPALAATLKSRDADTDRYYYAVALQDRNYVVFDGFNIEGGFIFDKRSTGCSNCTLKNSVLTKGHVDSAGSHTLNWGAVIAGASSYCTFSNVYVHSITNPGTTITHNSGAVLVGYDAHHNIIEYCTADASNDYVYSAFGQKGGGTNDNTYRYNLAIGGEAGFFGVGATSRTNDSDRNIYYQNIIVNAKNAFDMDKDCNNWKIYNNTVYGVEGFISGAGLVASIISYNNIVSNMESHGGNVYVIDDTEAIPLSYSDYNKYYFPPSVFARIAWANHSVSLSNWQSNTAHDDNSNLTTPMFDNAGGISAADYKRSSYPTDGRGGTYPSVSGAYIIGNEAIGYKSDGRPDSPQDFTTIE